MKEVSGTCCYCGVGCGVVMQSDGTQILAVRGDAAHPSNLGKLCVKGQQLHLSNSSLVRQTRRLLQPHLRRQRDTALEPTAWPETLDFVAERIANCIEQHGKDSVAFYLSGQLLTEDYYVFNKMVRALLGSNQIDSNSRMCMSSAVTGYKRSLGSDAPPACYDDIELADLVFIVGANPAYAHPVLFRRLEAARKLKPAMKVVVIDPRKTDSAREADLHLQIQPGTDVALFHGMLHIAFWEGWLNTEWMAQHTEGFDELRQLIKNYPADYVARLCGISEADLYTATRWFCQSPAVLSLYCQGLNQSTQGSDKNSVLINLHLATAQIGRPGCGPFSLTGQPNAMGGREVGAMATLLPGHRELSCVTDRAELEQFWGGQKIPAQAGKSALEMFDGLLEGSIKIIWIVCTNPLQSLPDQQKIRAALQTAELVIVQETFRDTSSAEYADVILPASSWGEKRGTVTNSERRISLVQAAIAAPGEARPDWWIATQVAQRIRSRWQLDQPDFSYHEPEQIWNEHRELTRGRDLDITGLSYTYLTQHGPQHWPFPEQAGQGGARLYQDCRFAFADGKARFIAAAYQAAADQLTPRRPLILNTGRLRDHWHGMSRTGTNPANFNLVTEPVLELHPRDMQQRFLRDGDFVAMKNQRAEQYWQVRASADLRPGNAFLAMHWGSEYVGGIGAQQAAVNGLVSAAIDPLSKQAELKYSSIAINKHEFAWQALLMWQLPASQLAAAQRASREFFPEVAYAHCVPISVPGQTDSVALQLLLAHHEEKSELVTQLIGLAGLTTMDTLIYQDSRQGQRRLKLQQGRLSALLQTGKLSHEFWLKQMFLSNQIVDFPRAALFRQQAPDGKQLSAERRLCQCAPTPESRLKQIVDEIPAQDEAQILAKIRQDLGCGGGCGSCVPELKRWVLEYRAKVMQTA